MNNIIKRKWNQNSMVIIEDLQGMAFQAESGGHTFQISGIDSEGNAVALSGTPAGVMLRSDGQDVTLTCSVSGGVVSATLPANAYSVPGRFGLTIFLTSDGQKTAIYAAVGTVGKTSSGTVAPPAGSDVVDLVNAIAAAVATIPASYTDLMASVAPTYSSSGLYAVGSYAWYNGKLYRCTTAITSGETWTSGHWTLANLGSDLVDLKSALKNGLLDITGNYIIDYTLSGYRYNTPAIGEQATLTPTASTNYRCTWIECSPGDVFYINGQGGSSGKAWAFLDSNNYVLDREESTNILTNKKITAPANAAKLVVNANKTTTPNAYSYYGSVLLKQQVLDLVTALQNVEDKYLHYIGITQSKATSDYNNLLSNVPGNTFSWISGSWFNDSTISGSHWIITISSAASATTACQIAYDPIGVIYMRNKSSGTYNSWKLVSDADNNLIDHRTLANNTDLDSITTVGIYCLTSSNNYTNAPETKGTLIVVPYDSTIVQQIFITYNTGILYTRAYNGSWGDWVKRNSAELLAISSTMGPSTDLNSITTVGVYYKANGTAVDNSPYQAGETQPGFLMMVATRGSVVIQRIVDFNAKTFIRYKASSWEAWKTNTLDIYNDTSAKYFAFGDSITYGQIGGASGQSEYNYPACVGKILSIIVDNQGVAGQGLIKNWSTIQTNFITNLDMTGAKLITVGWAYNDNPSYRETSFGSYTDAPESNPTTVIGYYYRIMADFQNKCKDAKIILITGYGKPDGQVGPPPVPPTLVHQFDAEYEFADGNHTCREFYDELEKMCNLHGWSCINQSKGTVFNQWNASTLIGDQIHPTNAGYLLYGNFLAARIASLYGNIASW